MADAAPAKKSYIKMALGGMLGLGTGAVAMYFNAAFDRLVKPAKPLANFVVNADGLNVVCENRASGQSGYWDFGDGTALEAFDPNSPTVQHAYAKPGNYTVKLIVRNFLMEENDRSVSVDVAPPSNTAVNPPRILDLKVQPITDQVPATYRITGKVQNADEIVWRLGDKTEHLTAPAEQIDRYVTFEQDGRFPIVLTALSKNRKDPQVVVENVEVRKPSSDRYEAMVFVTDAMTKSEQRTALTRVPVPVRDARGVTKGFSKTITAAANAVIVKAEIDRSLPPVAKNVKCDVAKDGKSVTISGDWTVSGDALAKAAGGSDLAVPVNITQEFRTLVNPGRQALSGVMGNDSRIVVPLPPRPLGMCTRTVSVDFGQTTRDGKRNRIAVGTLDNDGGWTSQPITIGGKAYRVRATLKDEKVLVHFINPQ